MWWGRQVDRQACGLERRGEHGCPETHSLSLRLNQCMEPVHGNRAVDEGTTERSSDETDTEERESGSRESVST